MAVQFSGDLEAAGFIPMWLFESDKENGAVAQIHRFYGHGGGWYTQDGFKMDESTQALLYPGDPPMHVVAKGRLRDEQVLIYPYGYVAVVQPDGTFQAARID